MAPPAGKHVRRRPPPKARTGATASGAATPAKDAAAISRKMTPPPGGAVVRMYCTGLGDCFLLGFPAMDGKTSYVLIDCGVWKGTAAATPWMRRIMGHIRDEVFGRGIDLLVATHQHWDHLSGFGQAEDIFGELEVREVWLPWTEDPEDGTAIRLNLERRQALRAAMAAAGMLRQQIAAEPMRDTDRWKELEETADDLEAVLGFAGYDRESQGLAQAAGAAPAAPYAAAFSGVLGARLGIDDLLEIVRNKVAKPRYVRPSLEPLGLSRVLELRIYALGPPTDPKYLGKDDPSSVPGKSEVYLAGLLMNEDTALYAACSEDDGADERRELTYPFDRWQRFSREHVKQDPELEEFFRSHYLEDPDAEWRKIDTDWLEAASQLALNLDDHVNNTSLVLAFELGEGGPVLLFPGDAQVGSWLSWHQLEGRDGITAESLLNRTVLYKVGHHASHNATLKDKGLKLMTETSRLVAMIPVDEREARKPKGSSKDGWAMPYGKLLAELRMRAEERVLRADDRELSPTASGEVPQWNDGQRERWQRFAAATVFQHDTVEIAGEQVRKTLFIEHTVHADAAPVKPRARKARSRPKKRAGG